MRTLSPSEVSEIRLWLRERVTDYDQTPATDDIFKKFKDKENAILPAKQDIEEFCASITWRNKVKHCVDYLEAIFPKAALGFGSAAFLAITLQSFTMFSCTALPLLGFVTLCFAASRIHLNAENTVRSNINDVIDALNSPRPEKDENVTLTPKRREYLDKLQERQPSSPTKL